MPIYEYTCRACEEAFEELLVRSSDAEQVACPRCGSRKVKRQLSATAASPAGGGAPVRRPTRGCGPVG